MNPTITLGVAAVLQTVLIAQLLRAKIRRTAPDYRVWIALQIAVLAAYVLSFYLFLTESS